LKIGPHLPKLLSNIKWLTFLSHCIGLYVHKGLRLLYTDKHYLLTYLLKQISRMTLVSLNILCHIVSLTPFVGLQ